MATAVQRWGSPPDSAQLVAAHLAGDVRAFQELVCRYRCRLLNFVGRMIGDRERAEDLVQEAFIRLARNTGRIRDTDKAAAYLRSIVVNLSRDHNRRGLVSLRHRPPAVLDEPSAEETSFKQESRREVVTALRSLPHRQRECLALRYYLELSVDDIADALGVSANSVKTHLKRGLRGLAASLEPGMKEHDHG